MSKARDEFLNKMLGLENAAQLLDKGIDDLVAELAKRNINHKSADEAPVDNGVFGNLLADMIKAQAEMAEELDAVKAKADKVDQLAADNATLNEANKALTERLEAVEKARPRQASRAPETQVEADKIGDEVRKSLTNRDAFWNVEVQE